MSYRKVLIKPVMHESYSPINALGFVPILKEIFSSSLIDVVATDYISSLVRRIDLVNDIVLPNIYSMVQPTYTQYDFMIYPGPEENFPEFIVKYLIDHDTPDRWEEIYKKYHGFSINTDDYIGSELEARTQTSKKTVALCVSVPPQYIQERPEYYANWHVFNYSLENWEQVIKLLNEDGYHVWIFNKDLNVDLNLQDLNGNAIDGDFSIFNKTNIVDQYYLMKKSDYIISNAITMDDHVHYLTGKKCLFLHPANTAGEFVLRIKSNIPPECYFGNLRLKTLCGLDYNSHKFVKPPGGEHFKVNVFDSMKNNFIQEDMLSVNSITPIQLHAEFQKLIADEPIGMDRICGNCIYKQLHNKCRYWWGKNAN